MKESVVGTVLFKLFLHTKIGCQMAEFRDKKDFMQRGKKAIALSTLNVSKPD